MYGCESWAIKKLSAKESMLLNCGAGEDSWESLEQQWDPRTSTLNIRWKDWCWSSNTLSTWCKKPDAGKDWGQEEKGMTEDEMAGWHHRLNARVWVNSGSCWWTGRPGVLRLMGSQRVRHNSVTELNWTEESETVSHSVVSHSLRPHESQHTRPSCPSPTPRVHPDSHPSDQWCHPAISYSVVPFSSCLQSFLVSGSFIRSLLFASGGQSIAASALASVLPMNIQDLFL